MPEVSLRGDKKASKLVLMVPLVYINNSVYKEMKNPSRCFLPTSILFSILPKASDYCNLSLINSHIQYNEE
jgi:hypothetical protein